MRINLSEIPSEGRTFDFSNKDGKITHDIKDLVQDHPYEFSIRISPIGGAYEVRGQGKSSVDEVCSMCGEDLVLPIERKVYEYLIVEDERPRGSKNTHGNQSLDLNGKGPETTYLPNSQFNLGEFVHEQIALAWPEYPECNTPECKKRHDEALAPYAVTDEEVVKGHPAFSVLQNLKTNKKG